MMLKAFIVVVLVITALNSISDIDRLLCLPKGRRSATAFALTVHFVLIVWGFYVVIWGTP